jgi:hypothetical protein
MLIAVAAAIAGICAVRGVRQRIALNRLLRQQTPVHPVSTPP